MAQKFSHHRPREKELKPLIKRWEADPAIKHVIFGHRIGCRHRYAPGTVRPRPDQSGGSVTALWVYTAKGVMAVFLHAKEPS